MSLSIATLFKDGQEYMRIWPMQRELYALFPECRVIAATKFSIKVMPPIAVVTGVAFINNYGMEFLPQAIAMAAFFLSLPLQGFLWLGHRANQNLPPALHQWYEEIHHKMQLQGCALRNVEPKPKYIELARLLKTAFDELDKVFRKQWF